MVLLMQSGSLWKCSDWLQQGLGLLWWCCSSMDQSLYQSIVNVRFRVPRTCWNIYKKYFIPYSIQPLNTEWLHQGTLVIYILELFIENICCYLPIYTIVYCILYILYVFNAVLCYVRCIYCCCTLGEAKDKFPLRWTIKSIYSNVFCLI